MQSLVRLLAMAGITGLGVATAAAQDYPDRPIRTIVSTSPRGITDIACRILAEHITRRTGEPVVVDNRPGASGTIAMEALARAAPDGYTLGFASTGNITINRYLFANLPFDTLRDLVPIGPIGTVPLFLVVNGKLPVRTLGDFIDYAKAHPDMVNYAGAGAGTTPDLAGLEFSRRAGLELVMVPFRGTGPATTAVIAGDVQVTFVSMGPRMDYVREGSAGAGHRHCRARALHAGHADLRGARLPGLRDLDLVFAVRAARHSRKIIEQLNVYTRTVHDQPETERRLEANFVDPLTMATAEFAALV